MYTSKKYTSPPLVEAICEFRFASEEGNSLFQYVDSFYNLIMDRFPVRNVKHKFGVKIEVKGEGMYEGAVNPDIEFYQFKNESNNIILQLGDSMLTVNHLRTYSNWENYSKVILQVLKQFTELTGIHKIIHINIRYLNSINLRKTEKFDLDDYFNVAIVLPNDLESVTHFISLRTELWSEDEKNLTTISLRSAPGRDEDFFIFLLELGYKNLYEDLDIESLTPWLENAHEKINRAFESCLTDKCKQNFNQ